MRPNSRLAAAWIPLVLILVTGCKTDVTQGWTDDDGTDPVAPTVFSYAFDDRDFQQSFLNLQTFTSYETAASNVRKAANFAFQEFRSVTFGTDHFAFSSANVEYAHAVGLTGQGQTIAVVDEGFQVTDTLVNDELANKAIQRFGVLYQPSTSDPCQFGNVSCNGAHGTAVAAIAASDGASGQMTGVAPGAGLHLVSWLDEAALAQATWDAAASGVIVQNNSWGYDGYAATQANFNDLLADPLTRNYLDALQEFAKSGVIVFGASNDETDRSYDLSGALPDFLPSLEESFLLVGNVIPNLNRNGDITSATRLSAGCYEAARYCLVADGTVIAPDIAYGAPDETDRIAEWTGTSFAAPQVSGAIALLAEAFPGMSAQALRARLLASADNGFFQHEGYVQFSPAVRHGFNAEFGHGFMDVGAALLPIGGRYVSTAAGTPLPIDRALVVSRGSTGASVARALEGAHFLLQDGLGADFAANAESLAATATATVDPADFVNRLGRDGQLDDTSTAFADYVHGQAMVLEGDAARLALLLPGQSAAAGHFGLDWRQSMAAGQSIGIGAVLENGSVLGMSNGLGGSRDAALQASVAYGAQSILTPGVTAELDLRVGVAAPLGQTDGLARFGPGIFTQASAALTFAGIANPRDRLTVRASLPQAVVAGGASVMLPVARNAAGGFISQTIPVDLSVQNRQLDLSMDYVHALGDASDLIVSGSWANNAGHVAGAEDTTLGFAVRLRF